MGVSANRVGALRYSVEKAYINRLSTQRMPMLHHDFSRLLDTHDRLNPAQIEDAQARAWRQAAITSRT